MTHKYLVFLKVTKCNILKIYIYFLFMDLGSKNNIYTDALKQMLISSPPSVLTLHMKRFQQVQQLDKVYLSFALFLFF